jgi:uncharacterized membrane protein YfcA
MRTTHDGDAGAAAAVIYAVAVLSSLALLTYFVRGAVGAANSIVFNAAFVTIFALGLTGPLTLRDGLYYVALANAFAAVVMLITLSRSLKLEKLTVRYLAGSVPVNILFATLLTRWGDTGALAVFLALAVTLSGLYMALRPKLPPAPMETLERLAFPMGLMSGVLTGLYGMGGPIGLLLFNRSTDDPSLFRLRLTIVTGTSSLVRVVVLASQGAFPAERLVTAAWTIPAVAAGVALGMWVHRFLRPEPFRVMLGALIAASGMLALYQQLSSL